MTQRQSFNRAEKRKSPIIAIVGADGSGKTTISHELLDLLADYQPAVLCHLGKQTGNMRRAMRQYTLGKKVDRQIKKAGAVARERGVSFPVALFMFTASARRILRFAKMLCLHRMGYAILTDRYPQTAVYRVMDGPLLPGRHYADIGAKALMHLEYWFYRKLVSVRPDVVIRLNVDLDTAISRKPDHGALSLERKVLAVQKLAFNGAPVVDLDAGQPLEDVLEQARAVVRSVMAGYPPSGR